MLRPALLAAALLALAGSSSSSYTFRQRGTVAAPRAASYDGQPLERKARIEGHFGGTLGEDVEQQGTVLESGASGASVARKTAGGAVRFRAGQRADVGVELDSSWSPSSTTREGTRLGAPDDAVIDVAFAARTSTKISDTSPLRIGFVANLGAHSNPIARLDDFSDGSSRRDTTLLFRAAMVPSIRQGAVTFFGSVGLATESDVPADVFVGGAEDDPGAVADTTGAAFTLAAGATVEVGNGARLSARLSDAFTSMENTHYGPQVDIGLSFDIGAR